MELGLGKTYLAHGIGNALLNKQKDKKTSIFHQLNLLHELVKSFGDKTTIEFKDKLRCLDMLIIDDVQFLKKFLVKEMI